MDGEEARVTCGRHAGGYVIIVSGILVRFRAGVRRAAAS